MPPHPSHYHAYSLATRTVPKTRQVVMLYDGATRFLKQALAAIQENRIEERFRLLARASEIMTGLQNSIDFEQGGYVAKVLHNFYVTMSMRILSINLKPKEAPQLCKEIIDELKEMRDVWDTIDRTMNAAEAPPPAPVQAPVSSGNSATETKNANFTLSA